MIRVIVVDDEPPIQRIICRKIEDADAEFQVTATAYNGKEALEILEKQETDVLFADVSMPVMDGTGIAGRNQPAGYPGNPCDLKRI